MVNHHPAKFGGHRRYSSGVTMFLVVKEQDSTCSHLNLPLLSVFKGQALKTAIEENIYKEVLPVHLETTLRKEVKKKGKNSNYKAFCITCKHKMSNCCKTFSVIRKWNNI